MVLLLAGASVSLPDGRVSDARIVRDSSLDGVSIASHITTPTLGFITCKFRGSVAVGSESQSFQFQVREGPSEFSGSPYLSLSMAYSSLGQGSCDLDVSLWDGAGSRTGGETGAGNLSEMSIPYSQYYSSGANSELVSVSQVFPYNAGMWAAAVYCSNSSLAGGSFELTVSVIIEERLDRGESGLPQTFLVPSNAYRISAALVKSIGSDVDLSLFDGAGRRTGGFVDPVGLSVAWIPNSVYFGSTLGQDLVSVSPVRCTDGLDGSGEAWSALAYCVSGNGPASYGIVVDMEVDSDLDGVPDSLDIDPVRDLCVRLTVTRLVQLDEIDSGDNPWDPYVRLAVGEMVPRTEVEGGQGDAWGSRAWSRSSRPIQLNGDFHGNYTIRKNVPDDSRTVPLLLQVWDDDGRRPADICDISSWKGGGDENSQDGSTLHLTYDLLFQSWSGDAFSGHASGEADGSFEKDEDDAEIQFSISTEAELSFRDQAYLANKFSPVLMLDGAEDSGPLEIFAMLNQSQLRDESTRIPLREPPLIERDLSDYRTGSYMDLWDREVEQYQSRIYCRVFTSDQDTLVLQYWFFYLYDSLSPHQGDWEMVQFAFGQGSRYEQVESIEPAYAAYSQHYKGDLKEWTDERVQKEGSHPLVYVGLGGHASFFSGRQSVRSICPVTLLGPSPWLEYEGKWGSSAWSAGPGGDSVNGPVYRTSMTTSFLGKPKNPIAYIWHEPLYWMYRL